ncbi:MAG: methyltransferase [Leucothrix sp.]
METLHSPFGELTLSRWPKRKNDTLRAWDAADEYMLQHLADTSLVNPQIQILIINDAFGALSCALQGCQISSWSDSRVSHLATADNIQANADVEQRSAVQYLESVDTPSIKYDLVLIKIPKTLSLLEDQLIKLKPYLAEGSQIVAGAMLKHLPKSAFQLFEKHIGPLSTSLAKKKARLLFITPNPALNTMLNPALNTMLNPYPTCYFDQAIGLTLSNHANLFSRDHLDLGARFFLDQFTQLPCANNAIDLACGNGVLGIKYQQFHPSASIQFIDESYMAVASAKDNYFQAFPDKTERGAFQAEDGLTQTASDSVELILCNPPFHQQHVISEQVAMELFQHSKRCLKTGGELWIVANRHLDYSTKLNRCFGNSQQVASDKRFVVLRCKKR